MDSVKLQRLKARFDRLNSLYEVSQIIHSTLEPRQALNLILRETVRLMRASSASIVLLNPHSGFLEIEAAHGLSKEAAAVKLRPGEGLTGWVARHGKPARTGNVSEDSRYVMLRPGVRSELAVPLEVAGEIRGVLNVDSDREDAFALEDEQLLQEIARQAANVIHNTWQYEQFRLRARLFESLAGVGQAINSTLTLDEALKVITREACMLMGAKMSSLLMLDQTGEWLELRASHGAGPQYLLKPPLSVEDSLLGVVIRRKKALQVENVQTSSRYQSAAVAREEGLVSLLSVPLVFGARAMGTLSVYTSRPHSFSNEEIQILSALAEFSSIAIDKARLYERIFDLEGQLRRSEKLSVLGLLAAEVAHEIRNPLTVIKMLYHSLDLRFPAGDPRSRDVEIIGNKMDQLNKIIDDVLDLARSNEPCMAEVNLNNLIHDLALLTRHKLTHQRVLLTLKLELELPLIRGDATQLEQAFLNLTLNALEAMPDGGELTISSRLIPSPANSSEQTYASVEFKDNGQGMTAEQRKRAFTSLLSTTKKRGTGLGLAVVRRIVEAHGGRIEADSKRGSGTTVSLLLPAGS
jgi:signal transduction histidine kinase